jgi:hypothetical protein
MDRLDAILLNTRADCAVPTAGIASVAAADAMNLRRFMLIPPFNVPAAREGRFNF